MRLLFFTVSLFLVTTTMYAATLSATSFECNFGETEASVFSIVPGDISSLDPACSLNVELVAGEGVKATYNFNSGYPQGTFPLFDIVFNSAIDLSNDATLLTRIIQVHNFKSSSTEYSASSGVSEITINAYDEENNVLSKNLSLKNYKYRTALVPTNAIGCFYAEDDLSKLAKVKKITVSVTWGNNGWGAGYVIMPKLKFGSNATEERSTILQYDFTTAVDRENTDFVFSEGDKWGAYSRIANNDIDALYITENNVQDIVKISLYKPLKMTHSVGFTLKGKVASGVENRAIRIALIDGKGNTFLTDQWGKPENGFDEIELTQEIFNVYMQEKLCPEINFDFDNIRAIELHGSNKVSESTIAIKTLQIGMTGEEATQTTTNFKYDFSGNRLYSPMYKFSSRSNRFSRMIPDQMEVEIIGQDKWNQSYLRTDLTNTVDISTSPKVKFVIDAANLDYTDADETVRFVLIDSNDKEVVIEKTRPDGELVLDYTGMTDIDFTQIKSFLMQSTTWGKNATGTFDVSYIEIGYDDSSIITKSESTSAETLSAWVKNDILYLNGIEPGTDYSIYMVNGTCIEQGSATSDFMCCQLPQRGIYIVKTGCETTKIIY